MPTELKAAADIRREVEEAERLLTGKQSHLARLLQGTQTPDGHRVVQPHEADAIKSLEAECQKLKAKTDALKFDFLQIKTEEELNRRQSDVYRPAMTHVGGNGNSDGEGDAQKAAPVRLPESLGDALVNSEGYRRWTHGSRGGQMAYSDVPALNLKAYALKAAQEEAMKATLTTSGMTSIDKLPAVIQLGQQMLTVADLFANAQTNNTTVRYLQETSFTNTAAFIAENAQKPEATWALAEVDAPVTKVAWLTRTTTEMFEDYPATRDYINQRLPFGVRQQEEFQLLNGNGTAPNMRGVLNVSGILTQAKGSDNNIDALYKGITKVRTQGFFEPDAIVIDPTNWTAIQLIKATTGQYLYGEPGSSAPRTLFGVRVVITANMGISAANTAIVGAWNLGGTVFYRQGIRIEATNSDASDFAFNRIAIRAEQRECLAVWRPKAFCTVTGLDVG